MPVQLEFAANDPGDVEQIIDQARFDFDVAPDHLQLALDVGGNALILLQHRDRREDGRQRCPQFVAEDGEEIILRLVGRFRRFLGAAEFLFVLFTRGDVHVHPAHPHDLAGGVVKNTAARRHVPDGAVEINDAKVDVDGAFALDRLLRGALQLRTILGMNDLEKRFHRPVKIFLRPPKERIHVIVPDDAAGFDVPVPRPGARAFEREAKPLFSRGERGVALADAHEHAIERVGQLPDLVVAVLDRADRVIGQVGDRTGDAGELENRDRDALLQGGRDGDRA